MFRFRSLTIRKKLTYILMGISAVAVLLTSIALYIMVMNQYRESYRSDLAGLADVIGHNCQVALMFDIREDAEKVLTSLGVRKSICCAFIYDSNGNIFADYNRDHPKTDKLVVYLPEPTRGDPPAGFMEINHDILLDGQVVGSILLRDDMGPLDRFQWLSITFLFAAVIIALLIAFLLTSRLQGVISAPIVDLADLTRQVSEEQDYSLRAVKHGEDEVGNLVDSFNEMLSQIQARNLDLQDSEKRFRALVDQSVDAFFLHDADGHITDVNKRACDSLGYPCEELLGMTVEDIDTRASNEEYSKKFWQKISLESPVTIEGEHRRKDGSTFPVEVRLGQLKIGNQEMIMGVARDISERKAAEEEKSKLQSQLQQSQKMESIGTLAGGIAHDFNNILMPIYGYTALALKELTPEQEKVKQYLDEVEMAASRARDLVKQILTFSRQEVEDQVPVQIHLIIKEALKLLRASIPTTIEIRQEISKDCGCVLANPTQIHQILMNLCTNAYHAMRDTGGTLAVSLKPYQVEVDSFLENIQLAPGPYLRLEVSDTGHGMDRETIERVFEPYYTTKPQGEGTGMGLSVVHGIVNNHGGHISVYSEPGVGTSFNVYLPVLNGPSSCSEIVEEEEIPTGNEHILVVDDEDYVIRMLRAMLETIGYSVTAVTDADEALQLFKDNPDDIDLVLTDMTMPKMTGYVLAQELMKIREDLPVIMCTGFSEILNKDRAKEIGVRDFIMKPFALRKISNAVRRALDGKSEP